MFFSLILIGFSFFTLMASRNVFFFGESFWRMLVFNPNYEWFSLFFYETLFIGTILGCIFPLKNSYSKPSLIFKYIFSGLIVAAYIAFGIIMGITANWIITLASISCFLIYFILGKLFNVRRTDSPEWYLFCLPLSLFSFLDFIPHKINRIFDLILKIIPIPALVLFWFFYFALGAFIYPEMEGSFLYGIGEKISTWSIIPDILFTETTNHSLFLIPFIFSFLFLIIVLKYIYKLKLVISFIYWPIFIIVILNLFNGFVPRALDQAFSITHGGNPFAFPPEEIEIFINSFFLFLAGCFVFSIQRDSFEDMEDVFYDKANTPLGITLFKAMSVTFFTFCTLIILTPLFYVGIVVIVGGVVIIVVTIGSFFTAGAREVSRDSSLCSCGSGKKYKKCCGR